MHSNSCIYSTDEFTPQHLPNNCINSFDYTLRWGWYGILDFNEVSINPRCIPQILVQTGPSVSVKKTPKLHTIQWCEPCSICVFFATEIDSLKFIKCIIPIDSSMNLIITLISLPHSGKHVTVRAYILPFVSENFRFLQLTSTKNTVKLFSLARGDSCRQRSDVSNLSCPTKDFENSK